MFFLLKKTLEKPTQELLFKCIKKQSLYVTFLDKTKKAGKNTKGNLFGSL